MDKNFSKINIEIESETFSFELSDLSIIEDRLEDNLERLGDLDSELERLTNSADKFDIWVSIASGLLTGLLDVCFIGELKVDINNGVNGEERIEGEDIVNNLVKKVASWTGYEGSNDLSDMVEYLEEKFHIDCDDAYRQTDGWVSSHRLHHLEDLCHHPTLMGFLAAICLSFLRIVFFSNNKGKTTVVKILSSENDLRKTVLYWSAILVSGLLYWMSCALCREYTNRELSEFPKWQRVLIKFGCSLPALGAIGSIAFDWAGHLISDMAGSKKTAGAGMGIPGLFISLMKELSMLPLFNKTNMASVVQRLYSQKRTDLRDELIPVGKHLGKQSIPVIINELIISTFYFIRRLTDEYHRLNGEWVKCDWMKTIPFFNRTIVRMRSISSGVFVAVDTLGAAIETAFRGEGIDPTTFIFRMALKMNVVGVGKFTIDLGKDVSMSLRKNKMRRLRSQVMMESVFLMGAKVYIQKNNLMQVAENVNQALDYLSETSSSAISDVCGKWNAVINDFSDVGHSIQGYRGQHSDVDEAINLYL